MGRRTLPARRLVCLLIGVLVGALTTAIPTSADLGPGEALSTSPSMAYSLPRAFEAGERLRYELYWFSIQAGTAVMEVTDSVSTEGRPALKLLSIAKSSPIVSAFYPVNNRVESIVEAPPLTPRHMVFHRREGRRKNDFDVTFHHAAGTVRAVKDGTAEDLTIPPGTQDILSCLYYIRTLPSLVPGKSVTLNVHHDKKNYRLEIRVEGIDRVPSPWGQIEAVRVLAVMPFQGLFLNEGNIRVWLTNDVRRVPVSMKAKVMIGSITARLVSASGTAFP